MPRDDSGGRGLSASGRQNTGRHRHALDILGAGLHRTRMSLRRALRLLGLVRWKTTRPVAARARVEAASDDLLLGVGIEHRTQDKLEARGVDTADSLVDINQAFVDHVYRDPYRRSGGALPRPGLEQVRWLSSTVNSMSCMSLKCDSRIFWMRSSSAYTSGMAWLRGTPRRPSGLAVSGPACVSRPRRLHLERSEPLPEEDLLLFGSRVKHTPVAEVSPMLPNTIAWFTAVPVLSGMPCDFR